MGPGKGCTTWRTCGTDVAVTWAIAEAADGPIYPRRRGGTVAALKPAAMARGPSGGSGAAGGNGRERGRWLAVLAAAKRLGGTEKEWGEGGPHAMLDTAAANGGVRREALDNPRNKTEQITRERPWRTMAPAAAPWKLTGERQRLWRIARAENEVRLAREPAWRQCGFGASSGERSDGRGGGVRGARVMGCRRARQSGKKVEGDAGLVYIAAGRSDVAGRSGNRPTK